MLEKALENARQGVEGSDADLFEELRIPSVSALPEHKSDVRRNADWLAARMQRLGMTTSTTDMPGGRHPVLQGDLVVDPALPTLTIYGHYDVQPADPVEGWESPPFEPTVRNGKVYARGSSDNKGNHMAALKAVEFWKEAGGPPVNVRFLIEGEEEITLHSLGDYLRENARRLQTDWVLLWDGGFTEEDEPAIVTALRGILYVELRAEGPGIDLHSGSFGGVAPNPLNTLSHVLSGLKAKDGRILIPGFYDDVRQPSAEELKQWEKGPAYEETIKELSHSRVLEGEADYPPIQRRWSRPTLDVHGIWGGFMGEGVKTVIPTAGMAKVSMRLVPDQVPDKIQAELERYVDQLSTPGVRFTVTRLGATRPVLVGTENPAVEAATKAFEESFKKKTQFVRSGGSVPVAIDFLEALGAPMVVSGLPQSDSAAHSPNECYDLDHYHRGIEMLIRFMAGLPGARR